MEENKNICIKILEIVENFFLNAFDKIGLKRLANVYRNHKQGMRYLVFGALATVVNIVSFAICSRTIFNNLLEGPRIKISNGIANIISILFAYITNKIFVFQSKTNNTKELIKEIGSFMGCRVITAILDMELMKFLVVTMKFDDILMKILVNVIVIILNFIFSKLIIFNKKDILKES